MRCFRASSGTESHSVAAVSLPVSGVVETHLLHCRDNNLIRFWCSLLGRAVHAHFQLVHLTAHAEHPHALPNGLQLGWQQNLDSLVLQKAIWFAGESNRLAATDLQGFFESRDNLVVTEPCGVALVQSFIGLLKDVAQLRLRLAGKE